MARVEPESSEVNARILYWGIDGAGKRTNLRGVFAKLRPDHRGSMREVPTRLDPSVCYWVLPIELGEVAAVRTRIELVAVPGTPEQAPVRKQLLDQVDGVVLVVDADPGRAAENAALVEELRKGLADYARRLEDLPLVVQYNKRDLTDDYGIDELHRRLGLGNATVFEAVATEGRGILQTLSTISKKVMRALREESIGTPARASIGTPAAAAPVQAARPAPIPVAPPPVARAERPSDGETRIVARPPTAPTRALEDAILEETSRPDTIELDHEISSAESLLEAPWPDGDTAGQLGARIGRDLVIVSVGEASRVDDKSVRVPIVLGDGLGETSTLLLTIRLDALVDEDRR
ncbi:MAG TPA: ADP-ribosylation factor-like protein [Myxococcota bacterium]|nr:ADP-ribosylation factor-like protein [Myxococcota bacterium]